MKKLTALLICLFLLLAIGCAGGGNEVVPTPEPTEISSPTPAPTPTPEPRVLFAGEVWKADALHELLAEDGIVLERFDSVDTLLAAGPFPGLTVAALYQGAALPKGKVADLAEQGVKVALFDSAGTAADGATVIPYSGTGKGPDAADMLEALLAFPPHDSPVRLFGMFTEESSPAHNAWTANVGQGKILAKAVYFKSGEKILEDWVESTLKNWLPGTLDGVYCETVEMAEAMVRALAAAGRVDMEVFSVEQNAAYASLQAEFPKLAVCSYQPDSDAILVYMASFIRSTLAGNPPPAPSSVTDGWHYSKPNTL